MFKSSNKSLSVRLALVAAVCICGGGGGYFAHAQSVTTPLSPQAQVGQQLFFDTNLSSSKKMSCATCHDPNNHYAPSNALPVQFGGPNLTTPGFRAVPTLTYKDLIPPYSDNATNPDGVSVNSPGGGFTWDGRANTLAQQVAIPLLSSFEMANTSQAAVVQVVQSASYAALFQQAFGADVFSNTATAFMDVGFALQQYQLEDPSFHSYTSKYDYTFLVELSNGKPVTFTAAENRGYNIYLQPDKGNCFACHYNGPVTGGGGALFTDFTFEALGVPRNSNVPANVTHPGMPTTYYDLGLCTAQNATAPHTLPGSAQYCGLFKTPTLRNAASRQSLFHNGVFHNLTDLINWYNTRDTNPAAWYPTTVKGAVQKFNDMPAAYQANLDSVDVPFDGLPVGGTPHMTTQDTADLQCFLETLVDGYVEGVTPQDPNCVN